MLYNIWKLFVEFEIFEIMNTDSNTSQFALTITFIDPDLTNKELDEELTSLLEDLNANSYVESVTRLRDPNPPDGNKSGGGLLDLLKADANPANALKVLKFLGDRFGNKPISLEAEINGVKMKVSASSQEEVKFAINEINEFIEKYKA